MNPSYTLDGTVRLFGLELAVRVCVTSGEPLVQSVSILRQGHREPLPMSAVHGLMVPAGRHTMDVAELGKARFIPLGQYLTDAVMAGLVRS